MQQGPSAPDCPSTVEVLVLDGANGICSEARSGAGTGGLAHVGLLCAASVVVGLLVAGARAPRLRALLLVIAASLASLPGLYALAVERADSPAHTLATARSTRALHDRIRAFATQRGCAVLEDRSCQSCFPIRHFALSGLRCDHRGRLELLPGSVGEACVEDGDTLRCGATR